MVDLGTLMTSLQDSEGSKMGDPYPPRRWLLGVGFRSAIGAQWVDGDGVKRSPWVRGIQAGLYIFVFKQQ